MAEQVIRASGGILINPRNNKGFILLFFKKPSAKFRGFFDTSVFMSGGNLYEYHSISGLPDRSAEDVASQKHLVAAVRLHHV